MHNDSPGAFCNGPCACGGGKCARGMVLGTVQAGDTVSVDYIGKLENGTVFDTSYAEIAKNAGIYNPQRPYEPLSFIVGADQMIKGFDEGVLGLNKGEEKELTIPPEKAYGPLLPEAIVSVPLSVLEKNNITAEVGMLLQTTSGMGKVTAVNETHATVDFNHALAGKTLVFTVKVEKIEKPKAK